MNAPGRGTDGIIGGVFPLESVTGEAASQSLLSLWSRHCSALHCFHNGRSAFRHLVTAWCPRQIWLPAYVCPDVVNALRSTNATVRFYPIGAKLTVDIGFLEANAREGDAIATVNYFGKPQSPACREALFNQPGRYWIEDCAQSLYNEMEPRGDAEIYSPRKLLGAPDGGVLVVRGTEVPPPRLIPPPVDDFMRPYALRADDPCGENRAAWFAAFQEAETAMAPCNWAMSSTSLSIIENTDAAPIHAARESNYRMLLEALPELALFDGPPHGWVPFGFPLLAPKAEALLEHLYRHRVFAPQHWRDLPSPPSEFTEAHALAARLITLPCDQRYGEEDMVRMIRLVREICR